MKSLYTALRDKVQEKIAGCECGGSGMSNDCENCEHGPQGMPECCEGDKQLQCPVCPQCAPLRELVGEICWHDIDPVPICSQCKKSYMHLKYMRIDLTTHQTGTRLTVITWLDRAGMLDEFVEWHNEQVELVCYGNSTYCVCYESIAEILLDGKLLCDAILSWLKGR